VCVRVNQDLKMKDSPVSGSNKSLCVVVGTGSIGQRHIMTLRSSGKVDVFAFPVQSRPHPELQESEIKVLENWGQVQDLGVQHVIIATNTRRHAADIQSAMEAGCNILVEKPMAVNAEEAFSRYQEVQKSKLEIRVGCCMRFNQALNVFRRQLSQIGKIFSVRIECQSYLPDWRPQRPYKDSYSADPDEGGVLRDLVHEFDYASWIFGWPQSVTAKVRRTGLLGIPSEDSADILWETEGGVMVSITLDYLSRPTRRQMRAFGELGTLEWDGIKNRVVLSRPGNEPSKYNSSQARDGMYLEQDLAFLSVAAAPDGMHDERLASGADGVRVLAICDAARAASKKNHENMVIYPIGL
jgi:predicted dehydrogenase